LTAEEAEEQRKNYDPQEIIATNDDLNRVMQLLRSGHFNQFEPGIFDLLIQAIENPHDPWLVAADFVSYLNAQERVAAAYQDQQLWIRMSILNTAAAGKFSADRTMQEYNEQIWKLPQVPAFPVHQNPLAELSE